MLCGEIIQNFSLLKEWENDQKLSLVLGMFAVTPWTFILSFKKKKTFNNETRAFFKYKGFFFFKVQKKTGSRNEHEFYKLSLGVFLFFLIPELCNMTHYVGSRSRRTSSTLHPGVKCDKVAKPWAPGWMKLTMMNESRSAGRWVESRRWTQLRSAQRTRRERLCASLSIRKTDNTARLIPHWLNTCSTPTWRPETDRVETSGSLKRKCELQQDLEQLEISAFTRTQKPSAALTQLRQKVKEERVTRRCKGVLTHEAASGWTATP